MINHFYASFTFKSFTVIESSIEWNKGGLKFNPPKQFA